MNMPVAHLTNTPHDTKRVVARVLTVFLLGAIITVVVVVRHLL